jgi:entericidin B
LQRSAAPAETRDVPGRRRGSRCCLYLEEVIMMLKSIALAVAVWIALLAGCNTMDGFGQDMERGGEKIQEKAKK